MSGPLSVTGRNVFTLPDENAAFFQRKVPKAGAAFMDSY
jgi:hypothetical protein